MLSDYTLTHLWNGSLAYAAVGRIPPDALEKLGWSADLVRLGSKTALKIRERHPDIKAIIIRRAWRAIADGLYIHEPSKSDEVLVSFIDQESQKIFFFPLKFVRDSGEIWLKTIHRGNSRQLTSKCRRGRVLRKAQPREWVQALQAVGPARNPTSRSSPRAVLRPAEFHRVTLEAAYRRILECQSVKAKAELGVAFC